MVPNHKRKYCLNCHQPLLHRENYCPRCGQVNNDFRLSVWELLKEFFDNYLNFDSRMYRTIFPFLFMPGHLTVSFMNGRRKRYVHPVRLYLVMSLFFFFVFSQTIDWEKMGRELSSEKEDIEYQLRDSYFPDSAKHVTMRHVLDKAVQQYQLPESEAAMIGQRFSDKDKMRLLSLYYTHEDTSNHTNLNLGDSHLKIHNGKFWNIWIKDKDMTPDALLDSVQATNKNAFNRYLAGQALKFGKFNNRPQVIVREIVDNIPVTIFFLLPIFAFFLKIVHIRSHKLYIEHLIATFNLHAYVFLFFGIAMLFPLFKASDAMVGNAMLMALILTVTYTLLMFRRVYKQGWIKTIVKLWLLFSIYSVVILFFSIFEVLASILLF